MDTANQFLSLALFIMLLSFFIILNALSSFEETKSKPVLNSVALAFSTKPVEENLQPNVVESPMEAANEGDTLDKLESLFNAHITGVDTRKNRLGTIMRTRMTIDAFQTALTTPASASGSFMPTLTSLLQTKDTETVYRMDMIINISESPAKAIGKTPEDLKQNLQKAAFFSKRLEDSGVPRKLLSSGLGRGDAGYIDIYFRRHQPFNPMGIKGFEAAEEEG